MPDEEHDIPVVNADYEIPVVTTDIAVTPCPAYTTTTFTETEVIPVVTTDIAVTPCPAYTTTTFTETEVIPVVTVTTDCGYKDVDTSPESIVVTTPTKVLVNSK